MSQTSDHVHDCTGIDARCPCGYVFTVPPICVSIEVYDQGRTLVNEAFNCSSLTAVIEAFEEAIRTLKEEDDKR